MPILKQLVSSSSQSKRRSRADLTTEMISAPLGDFRHTMHVGRGGDAFGDTSFLSSRSGEPPRDAGAQPGSPGPKPGLLSRTFRSSKRSQSVTRADKCDSSLAPPGASSMFVKTAVSLPHLGDEGGERNGSRMPKSLSSSPIKKPLEPDGPAANGATSLVTDTELDERSFGEPTDLSPLALTRPGGGMKHAESIMSFHIDLGPSMLGDILSVMEKGWDEDDLGFEDGRGSEGHWSPLPGTGMEEEKGEGEEPQQAPLRPTRAIEMENHSSGPYTPEPRPRRQNHHHLDSCSVSSSGSGVLEEKPLSHLQGGDTDSAKYSSPRGEDEKDFSFMDEDEDEIRV